MAIEIEKHQRGIVGWIVLAVFWAFNLVMLLGALKGLREAGERAEAFAGTAAEGQVAFWNGMGLFMYFGIWFFGAAILGLMMWVTRGRKVVER